MTLGATTGAWAVDGADERLAQIRGWQELPDLASVNWHEDGTEELAAHLNERNVGIEAGLWTVDAAEGWASSPHAAECRRILVEVPDLPDDRVRATPENILAVIAESGHDLPILLHGEERSAWPAVRLARELGLDTRIGLEDTLTRPDGTVTASNAELVALCRDVWRS
ncbi:3-keto-5-aminohexanoate cleavage protein [Aeromicrobium camelliae]|uniref:3-keto-5-aminohexanoate cleavage protein n=1 Tax=Aeromicrobium camelliae TaxID=1538144 RepID=UPI001AA085E4|nr:3-keto-5-aminohexanoate cleavage protein [Aeromicrobium camelliae]